MNESKKCKECGKRKPIDQFHLKRGKPQAKCKKCRSKYMANRYQANIEVEQAKRRKNYYDNREKILLERKEFYEANKDEINLQRRLKKYGLTKDQYFDMLTAQDFKCANKACKSKNLDLAIDHCHVSLAVRGILCDNCNTALGLLKDCPDAIDGLKTYLKNTRS